MQQLGQIECRHCGRPCSSKGFWKHLKTHPEALSYEAELKAHGVTKKYPKRGWEPRLSTMALDLAPGPAVVKALLPVGRLSISREALQVALSGLERVKGELEGYIAEVRATLDPPPVPPPVRKYQKLLGSTRLEPQHWEQPKPKPKPEPITFKWIYVNGVSKRVWSNDPERKFKHRPNGEFMINAITGQPRRRPPAPSEATLDAMKKARARRWAGHAKPVDKSARRKVDR